MSECPIVRLLCCQVVRLSTRHPPGFPLEALSGCKRRHLQAQDEGRRPEEVFAPPCRGKLNSFSTGLTNNITCNQAFCLSLVLPSRLQFHQQTWSITSVFLYHVNFKSSPWPVAWSARNMHFKPVLVPLPIEQVHHLRTAGALIPTLHYAASHVNRHFWSF